MDAAGLMISITIIVGLMVLMWKLHDDAWTVVLSLIVGAMLLGLAFAYMDMDVDEINKLLFFALAASIFANMFIWDAYKSFKSHIFKERIDEFKKTHPDISILDEGGVSNYYLVYREDDVFHYEFFCSESKSRKRAKQLLMLNDGIGIKCNVRGRFGIIYPEGDWGPEQNKGANS